MGRAWSASDVCGGGGGGCFLINSRYERVEYKPGVPEIELWSSSPVGISVPEYLWLQTCQEVSNASLLALTYTRKVCVMFCTVY
jgi:hypothetical protein